MAQKAKKERAARNLATLLNLHAGSLVVNLLFIITRLLFTTRSWFLYLLLTAPSFACQFALERSGRPKHNQFAELHTAGEDLNAPGLTEYMFDVIWVTWACEVLVVLFGDKAWFLWLVVPAYGAYKGYDLLGMARGLGDGMQGQGTDNTQAMPQNRKQRRAGGAS